MCIYTVHCALVYYNVYVLYNPSLSLNTARGGLEVEQKTRFNAPKIKQLKVLDAKSAQNICKICPISCLSSSIMYIHVVTHRPFTVVPL